MWNRGAYLVNGPGHCAECHSPRNFLGGIVASERFAGGPAADGKGWVPNITQKALAKWSAGDIAYLLESGFTPDGDSVGSTMGEVVKNTSQLSEDDRKAIGTYIKSLPPVDGPPRPKKKKCHSCHSGRGARKRVNPESRIRRTARLASGIPGSGLRPAAE